MAGALESSTPNDGECDNEVTKKNDDETEAKNTAGDNEDVIYSYPKPRNFAERMMNALERGIASDSISWAGDGKGVALHTNKLKDSPELTSYFKAKDYSAFIRNCNRWYVFFT